MNVFALVYFVVAAYAVFGGWTISSWTSHVNVGYLLLIEALIQVFHHRLPVVSVDPVHATIHMFMVSVSFHETFLDALWLPLFYSIYCCFVDWYIKRKGPDPDEIVCMVGLTLLSFWTCVRVIYLGNLYSDTVFDLVQCIVCAGEVIMVWQVRVVKRFIQTRQQYMLSWCMKLISMFYLLSLIACFVFGSTSPLT